jgi:hypothetical protein
LIIAAHIPFYRSKKYLMTWIVAARPAQAYEIINGISSGSWPNRFPAQICR